MPPKGKPKRRRRINWCATHRLDIDDLLVVIGSTIGLSKRESARALVKAFDMGDTSWVPDQAAARAKAAPGAKPRYWRISIMMPSRYRALLFNAVLAAFGLVSVSVIAPAQAAGPELTICGGVIDGRYNKFASDFGAQLRDILVPKVLVTEGSLDNLSKLSSGECAAGLAQADAMFAQQQRDPNFKLIAEVVGTAYDEVAHLVCPKSADIRSIKDMRKRPGDFVLFVGPQNGGSQITWETITRAVKEYSAVPLQYVGGQRAITRVVDGPNSFELGDKKVTPCIFWIGGVGAGLMKDADDVRMKLVDIDDGDIVKNAKDKFGKPLYEETKIPSKIYPKMGDVHTFSDVSSIKTHAVLMVSTNWADTNAQTYDLLLKRFRSFTASQQSK